MVINAALLSLIVCGIASSAGFANYCDSSQHHTALPAMLNQFTRIQYTHARLHVAVATILSEPWQRGRRKAQMFSLLKGNISSGRFSAGNHKLAGRVETFAGFLLHTSMSTGEQMQAANRSKPSWGSGCRYSQKSHLES